VDNFFFTFFPKFLTIYAWDDSFLYQLASASQFFRKGEKLEKLRRRAEQDPNAQGPMSWIRGIPWENALDRPY